MKVYELVEWLERLDQELPVSVFRPNGDYGTPMVVQVQKGKRIVRVTIVPKEDE